jgi:hypothetical protein
VPARPPEYVRTPDAEACMIALALGADEERHRVRLAIEAERRARGPAGQEVGSAVGQIESGARLGALG